MPELPEVTTIVRELNVVVRGKVICQVAVRAPKLVRPLTVAQFRAALVGRTFRGFKRRAKFIMADMGPGPRVAGRRRERTRPSGHRPLADSLVLLWHMGMTGHLLYRDAALERRRPLVAAAMADPMNRHVRVVIHFTDRTRLEYVDVRLFGTIELVRPEDLAVHPRLARLGPDALSVVKSPRALCARLRVRRTSVKVALLDQTVLAGVGNIYADESLWRAGLHPLRSVQTLTVHECRRLARALCSILHASVRARGTSIDDYRRLFGDKGRYGDQRAVYQRAGAPCRRCGTLIQRLVVGGRGTHVCSRCQLLTPRR